MEQIPDSWLGTWIDDTGKVILLEYIANKIAVTVNNAGGDLYPLHLLVDETGWSKTLQAEFAKDNNGNTFLRVEAGQPGLGPTYDLYFLTSNGNGKYSIAQPDDPIGQIIIKPAIGMGLYDDLEDDLGVPWALPLLDLVKTPPI